MVYLLACKPAIYCPKLLFFNGKENLGILWQIKSSILISAAVSKNMVLVGKLLHLSLMIGLIYSSFQVMPVASDYLEAATCANPAVCFEAAACHATIKRPIGFVQFNSAAHAANVQLVFNTGLSTASLERGPLRKMLYKFQAMGAGY